jgi:ATP-dependent DNA helicase DinG
VARALSTAELFHPDGPVARSLAAYELRPGQLELARAVGRALEEERLLLSEAGTGTGKTLAYLAPALLSGKKVIISTATKALQEQIFHRDLPKLATALGIEPRAALMKGLSNYLCKRRYREFLASPVAMGPRASRELSLLSAFAEQGNTGDIAAALGLEEEAFVWSHVTSSSDTRVGQACTFYEECFVTQMKRRAEAARVVVVNHHLFFADLALRGPHPGRVLPDYDAVIFDEAHQLEETASLYFGSSVSSVGLQRWFDEVAKLPLLPGAALDRTEAARLSATGQLAADGFWGELKGWLKPGQPRLTLERDSWSKAAFRLWHALDAAIEAAQRFAEALAERPRPEGSGTLREALEIAARRGQALRDALAFVVESPTGQVCWLEATERSLKLACTPVDVGPWLKQRLFDLVPAIILTSATLSAAANDDATAPFSYVKSRLGIEPELATLELRVASPFDYEKQALLYLPRGLGDPREPSFLSNAAVEAEALIRITGGGCFVLCTSLRSMQKLHAELARRLPEHRVLLQGSRAKTALLDEFRERGGAVLVATMSFWQGVDVPGQALRLVILEKLPFSAPDEPVLKARAELLEAQGKNPFMELFLPQASILLKQGFGRLIRTRQDRGIVALLDERVATRSYGRKLLSTLPKARVAKSREEVIEFWRDAAAQGAQVSD